MEMAGWWQKNLADRITACGVITGGKKTYEMLLQIAKNNAVSVEC